MKQKSGKYWPGILLMTVFTVLCAKKLIPVLWSQQAWQVIPVRAEPIPLFGNSKQEEKEERVGQAVQEEVQEDIPAWKPVEEMSVPTEEPAGTEEIQPQEPVAPTQQVPQEEPWPETMLPGEKININKASVADLTRLPLVGEKRAKAIAAWRRKNGPFQELEDLLGVQGIGAATLEQLKRYITL